MHTRIDAVIVVEFGYYIAVAGHDIVFFFFNDTATTEIYTRSLVGSVRCV